MASKNRPNAEFMALQLGDPGSKLRQVSRRAAPIFSIQSAGKGLSRSVIRTQNFAPHQGDL